jgi:ribonuclease HI
VLTSASTMGWLWKAKGLQGRLATWAAMLSGWTLEIRKGIEPIHGFLGVVAASSAPKDRMNEALGTISPSLASRKNRIPAPIPTLPSDTDVIVASFDGSARSKRNGGSCSAILWRFPQWTVITTASVYFEDITVNEAEYRGLLLALELGRKLGVDKLVICGDSRLVIQQLRCEMECCAVGLQLLWTEASKKIQGLSRCDLVSKV